MRIGLASALLAGSALICGLFCAQSLAQGGWPFEKSEPAVARSHLGVGLKTIDADRANVLKLGTARGVEILSIVEGGSADRAGLKPGDVLLTYNGEEILSSPQIGRLVSETPPGRRVKIEYWRDGKTRSATVLMLSEATPSDISQSPPLGVAVPLGVPDFPRMLMLWDNVGLGIECEPIDGQIAEYFGVRNGILIRHVEKGYPAEKAGLRAGDVILSVDTRTVAAPRDLISYLRTQRPPGRTLSIQFVRDHKQSTVSLSLAE
jgi:serine protease Do